ncbi:MFS transporter [Pseudarthrobacter raffinosi]|uniref:MFS transporter n=1 Tax=Pseudarthrobacter raffinosi TaxID=2953651 RepID=UPI00208E31E6|nr:MULTISPECIES: MFS transporter [unclassified Pseudarthrobacter]MCO4236989.1 MFS transporter [Pseudarthrobacter sp. MDT3-28]MCO4250719.1 MFS transporter [Pseudarthrobacter sp. MDT3-9]MCO4261596.1 MFS transporter [Pseudarthrobacter sp. MDT3-26]
MTSQSNRLPVGALIVLAAIGFTAITTELLPSGLLPQISADFRVSEATAGYLTAGYAAIIVVTVIPLSLLLSRVPRHYLLIALILFFAASNALVAIVSDFGAAMGSRVVGGIAHGLLWSAMAPFVTRIVPAHKVGKALAIVFSGNSLGLAIGAPVGTALGNIVGWRAAFLVLAASGVVLALLAVWLLPPVRRIPDAPHPSIRKAIGQPGVKTVAVGWPLMLMAHFALFTYIAPFLREVRLPDFSIPLSISVLGVAGLVGIWIAGITVDSRPRRWLLITVAGVVVSVALLPLVGSVLPALALPVTLVLMLVWGTGIGAMGIYNQSAILRAGGEYRDAANGLTVLTIQIGIMIGAMFGAAALTIAGPLLIPTAAAIPAVVAFVLILAGRRHAYPPGPKERQATLAEATSP